MSLNLTRGLCLWAVALVLALVVIVPMSMPWRLALVSLVGALAATLWVRAEQRAKSLHQAWVAADMDALLQSVQRQPVVLVCGDNHGLFGAQVGDRPNVRFTAQGCYIGVPTLAQLPTMVAHLTAMHPDWRKQLSVLFAINPFEQTDQAGLASQIRALCHQLTLARKAGAALPLQLVTYLQGANADEAWFSWETERAQISVRHAGTCTGLAEWQRQAPDATERAERLRICVQLKSAGQWLAEAVLPHLPARERVVVCSITLVPELPRMAGSHLWQQWLGEKTGLDDTQQVASVQGNCLPFPDPLLTLLPRPVGNTAVHRTYVLALWMFTGAALIALVSSAWQNTLLMRRVSDDLNRYSVLPPAERRDQPEFVQRESAIAVLRKHAVLLDGYFRNGEPLSLGLGLYQAGRLRVPVLDAVAGYREPPVEKPAQIAEPIRLNSLSLFSVGSAELKPGSTKVLINALQHIQAQPGWLIVITGHTDATGGAEHNLQLSRARAASVRDWMQRMGDIHDSCFAVQGFGADQPIASNDIEVGRSANRRVDIRLVPEAGACVSSRPVADGTPPAA
ncbi:OmpA family protein [Pseudomonas sp. NPDC090202]|uniref:OmpA family protein n=1 Tax=unclassified Pseudomonas TaxID=196821 RepID=UPI0037FFF560